MYTADDIQLLQNNWKTIMDDVESKKLSQLEPTLEEMQTVHNIILQFFTANKRKFYGGFALNMLIGSQNPDDTFYKSNSISDIDVYSPEPLKDLIKLCNLLHNKGYKSVVGREALHPETYVIVVDHVTYCDITYVPKMINDKMPSVTITHDDMEYIVAHPHFMMVDYLRIMTDPLLSYWRIGNDLKTFKRYTLLQKYFQLPTDIDPIDVCDSSEETKNVLDEIYNFVLNRKSTVVIGFYAYNKFFDMFDMIVSSKGYSEKDKNMGLENIKRLQIPYYEIISTDFEKDCRDLLNILGKYNVIYDEYYPFFQFSGNSVQIYIGDDLVAKIFSNNNKSIPYQDIRVNDTDDIRIGTFPVVILHGLIAVIKAHVNKDSDTKNLYYNFLAHLIGMRNYYFTNTEKNFLDDTLFREFTTDCVGHTIQPEKQRKLLIESRKKNNKKLTFIYEPVDGITEPEISYVFANSSGNYINNENNRYIRFDKIDHSSISK